MVDSKLAALALTFFLTSPFALPAPAEERPALAATGEPLVAEEDGLRVVVQPAGTSWAAADAVTRVLGARSEQRFVIGDAAAPHAFDYMLAPGTPAPLPHHGAIRFARAGPTSPLTAGSILPPMLELRRPIVVDSAGRRSLTAASWTITSATRTPGLRLSVDPTGLQYPLVVSTAFQPAAEMHVARNNHIAALLYDGQVLIAGGFDGTNALASAEIFDAALGHFVELSDELSVARQNAAAVVLPDGRVLIAGGNDGTSPLSSAEIFDPKTASFSLVADAMTTTRNGASATLLNDGTVLITGGIHPEAISTAETWSPATQLFTPTAGAMGYPRVAHTTTLLTNGDVLVVGGTNGTARLATAEIYHPDTRTFTAAADVMMTARALHSATLLPNGRVLIAGGLAPAATLSSAELYDPATGTFSATDSMAVARYFHVATLLPSGKVLVAGGSSVSELFDPATGMFSLTSDVVPVRYNPTATLLVSGDVLIAGGSNGTTAVNSTDRFVEGSGSVTPTASPLSVQRFRSTATLLPDGKVLVAGGGNPAAPWNTAEVYDPFTDTFAPVGNMSVPRVRHTATALADGTVLLAGGSDNYVSTAAAETYSPATSTFTATAGPMVVARERHTATLLPDGTVLITGGVPDTDRAEIYDPATGRFTEVGQMTAPRLNHAATLLDDGSVLITGGDAAGASTASAELFDPLTRTFHATASMHEERSSHTATRLPSGIVLIAGGSPDTGMTTGSIELYFPGAGFATILEDLNTPRAGHRAVLLPNHRVLIAGGFGSDSTMLGSTELFIPSTFGITPGPTLSIEHSSPTVAMLPTGKVFIGTGSALSGYTAVVDLYDPGVEAPEARTPVITSVTTPLCQPAHLALAGSRFTSDSEVNGGRANSAAANLPHVRLEHTEGHPFRFAMPEASSASTFFSQPLSAMPTGRYRVAVVSGGVPSTEKVIAIETTPVVATYSAAETTLGSPVSVGPSSTPPGYAGAFYAQRATASGGFTGSMWVNGSTGVVHISNPGPVGSYVVTIASSNSCGSASTTFALTVLGPPSLMIASGGTPQSASINTAFATPLRVTVMDSAGHALENVSVAFTPPAAGASAILSASSALTNASGIASISATANGTMGSYTVTATVGGLTATFALKNVPATPTGTIAIANTTTSVFIGWTGTPGAAYEITRVSSSATTSLGNSASGAFTDNTAAAGTAYLYKVRGAAPLLTPYGQGDVATTITFADHPLVSGTTPIRAAQITELRNAVNLVRALAGLPAGAYTDPVITTGGTKVKALHVTDLRTALGAARAALSLPALVFARPTLTGQVIQATEIGELRDSVR